MTTTDRTPIIVALLADLVRERSLAAPDDADLLHLSDGLALAVDHGAVAEMWPLTGWDRNLATWLAKILHVDVRCAKDFGTDDDVRTKEIATARRLADVAASLLVRGDVHRAEAGALWDAAERFLGLQDEASEQVDRERLQVHVDLATAMAQRDPQMAYVATAGGVVVESNRTVDLRDQTICNLRSDLASMTEQRDEAIRQRDEARRQVKAWQCEEDERRRERDEARSKAGHADIVTKLLARTYETVTVALGRPASETPHLLDPGSPGDIASAVRLVVEERDVARADLASMTEQRDEAVRQRDDARGERDRLIKQVMACQDEEFKRRAERDEARRERDAATAGALKEAKPPAGIGGGAGDPTSIRSAAIAAGASECTVYMDDEAVRVVVDLRRNADLQTVAAAVFAESSLTDPRVHQVRLVGRPGQWIVRCSHRRPEVECPECSAGYG